MGEWVGVRESVCVPSCKYPVRFSSVCRVSPPSEFVQVHHVVITFFSAILVGVALMADMDEADTSTTCFFDSFEDLIAEKRVEERSSFRSKPATLARTKSNLIRASFTTIRTGKKWLHFIWSFLYFTCARVPSLRTQTPSLRLLVIQHRIDAMSSIPILHATVHTLRKNMLPALVVSTTVIILTSADGEESFEAVAIFLNVVAVNFICDVDNLMGKLLVNPQVHEEHEEALNKLKENKSVEIRMPVKWLDNRVYAIVMSMLIGMESMYMTDLILALNPLFGGPFLNIANSPFDRARHRVGVMEDANCNKLIFAIQIMTFVRAMIGCGLTFCFGVWRSITMFHERRQVLYRRLLLDVLHLLFGFVVNYVAYRLLQWLMDSLRVTDRAFACNWANCEALYEV